MATIRKPESEFQRRAAVLEKMNALGVKTEKAMLQMTIEKLLDVEGITIDELRDFAGLQKAVKAHALYEWLCAEPGSKESAAAEKDGDEAL